jgi:hypothetical protein
MVEEAKREPTVQEIVVALRETTFRGKGRGITVPNRRVDEFKRTPIPYPARGDEDEKPPAIEYKEAAFPDVADLRDSEMQRLLGENARLNERIVALLKIIEREQLVRNEQRDAERDVAHKTQEREAIVHEVKGTLEAELRPVLLTVLQLLEQPPLYGGVQRPPTRDTTSFHPPPVQHREAPSAAPRPPARHDVPPATDRHGGPDRAPPPHDAERGGYYSGWVPDLIRAAGGDPHAPGASDAGHDKPAEPQRQPSRGLFGRIIERMTPRHRPAGPRDGRRG